MMPDSLDRRPLPKRFAALRRRLRLVVTLRGLSCLLTVLLLTAAVAGLLDWQLHLPGLVRAVILVGSLSAAGGIALRFLLIPLAARLDDLALALRIEEHYPFLNDCLASTVQFLERAARREPVDETQGSASLRREAVERTLRQIQTCDFGRVVNSQGVGWAGLALLLSLALGCSLFYLNPALALAALERLAVPFGTKDWPRQTRLEIHAPTRLARGEAFELRGLLTGVIPDEAVIFYEGISPPRQVSSVRREKDSSRGLFFARLERVEKPFRFQVHAHDAQTVWYSVAVEPPPMLVPLEGRPSPLVHVRYPSYTALGENDLPDGSGNVEAVVGTHVTLRAAVDRPLARAWLEYRPEQPQFLQAAAASVLAWPNPLGCLALASAANDVTSPIPAVLDGSRQRFALAFLPRVRGMYAVHFEDDAGLSTVRLFDLHLHPDPPPAVSLERPSRAHDSLEVLPDAEVTVQVAADDPQFGLKSVHLEYRHRKDGLPRKIALYDYQSTAGALLTLGRGLMRIYADPWQRTVTLRPQHLSLHRRMPIAGLKRTDGQSPQEGDVIILQACAADFDNVSVDKAPGRSHEVELRVVSRAALEQLINQEQAKVQEELLRLRKSQQEALERVISAEQHWRNTGKLRPQEIDQLLQAEQLQQQIRTRIGTKQEGLRANVERILTTLRDNRLERSGTHDRMANVAAELERLARDELDQIEPRLTNARKENELVSQPQPPPKGKRGDLGEARQHQEEVENTLAELLKQLEPWGNLNAVKGETRSILQEQRGLNQEVQKLDRDDTRGKEPEALTPEQKAALGRAAELQHKLAERTRQLLDQMKRAGEERKEAEPELAVALREAAEKGEQGNLQDQLKNAGEDLRQNNLGNADRAQKAGIQSLEEMVRALEERREQELDRLRKKLQQAQDKLREMIDRQQHLRKKMKEATQLQDQKKREQELKRLAREQEQLREETQELLKELTRLRADQAGQALAEAGNNMEQSAQQLQRSEKPDENQGETLDRLNEAQRRLEQARARVEEELAREKLAKIADQLRQLKERQEAAVAEANRIQQQVAQRNQWTRPALINLRNLAEVQKALAQETDGLAKGRLSSAQVFARILSRAAEAMVQASQRMLERADQAAETPDDTKPDLALERFQGEAVRRLDQLLDALKNDTGFGKAPSQQNPRQRQDGETPEVGENIPGDGISYLAQLKVLRALQQDLHDRTADFGRKHPNVENLTRDEQQELNRLQKEQQELADLLEDLLAPPAREGEKK